jgi:hypothetical protein
MALNITFSCEHVKDENDNNIECNYQALHVRTNKFNTTRQTLFSQYSFNLGDGDFLTQNGSVLQGDKIVIRFWTTDFTRFAFVVITLTSSELYITNIQLRPKMAPIAGFSVPSSQTLGNIVQAVSSASDNTAYTPSAPSSSVVHYQHAQYSGINIFNTVVGLSSTFYNFDFTNGATSTGSSAIYTALEDVRIHTITQTVTNVSGQTASTTRNIQIRKNAPTISHSHTPNQPVLGSDVQITYGITDPNQGVISISNFYEGVLVNNLASSTITRNITTVKQHSYRTDIQWNDGYTNLTATRTTNFTLMNTAPIIDPTYELEGNHLVVEPGLIDFEDRPQRVRYVIQLCRNAIFNAVTNVSDCNFVDIDTKDSFIHHGFKLDVYFLRTGLFRIQVQGFDQDGGVSTVHNIILDINLEGANIIPPSDPIDNTGDCKDDTKDDNTDSYINFGTYYDRTDEDDVEFLYYN